MTNEAPSTRAADGWSSLSPYPWRRWAARLVDGIVLGGIFWTTIPVAIALTAPDVWFAIEPILYQPWFPLVEGMISIAVLIPVYAILIGASGLTPGKLLFGVRVLNRDERPIGFIPALVRELRVWVVGYAFGIPLVALFAMWKSKTDLEDNRATYWDKEGRHVVYYRPEGALQTLLAIVGIVIIVGGLVLFRILAEMEQVPAY